MCVSILDRPEGRSLRQAQIPAAKEEDVSILDRPEGRSLPGILFALNNCGESNSFNPRSPQRTIATPRG